MLQNLPIEIIHLILGYLPPVERKWVRTTCKTIRAKMIKPNKLEFKHILQNDIKYLIDYIRDYIQSGLWYSTPAYRPYIKDLIEVECLKTTLSPIVMALTKLVKQYNYGDDMVALGLKLLNEQVTQEAGRYAKDIKAKRENLYNTLLQGRNIQDLDDTNPEDQHIINILTEYYQLIQNDAKWVWIKQHTINKQVVLKVLPCPEDKKQFYREFAEPIHIATSLDLPLDLVSTIYNFMLTNLNFYLNDDMIQDIIRAREDAEQI